MCLCICVAGGIAAVSPGGFPMLIHRPGSIPPEMLAMDQQQRRSAATSQPQTQLPQHVTPASLAGRVCVSSQCVSHFLAGCCKWMSLNQAVVSLGLV